MKRFEDFLNESIFTKRFQYTIDKNSFEDFSEDLTNNAPGMGVEDWKIGKTDGVSKITVFLQFWGPEQSVNELIEWIKERY